jgi:tRNA(fMet)-specific endonuclease VapC
VSAVHGRPNAGFPIAPSAKRDPKGPNGGISAITAAELQFGAERRDSKKLRRLIATFTSTVSVMPFDDECASTFGKLAARLPSKGRPIGHYDALIAAHAVALGVTLVTNNEKPFAQVESLKLENWV